MLIETNGNIVSCNLLSDPHQPHKCYVSSSDIAIANEISLRMNTDFDWQENANLTAVVSKPAVFAVKSPHEYLRNIDFIKSCNKTKKFYVGEEKIVKDFGNFLTMRRMNEALLFN